MMKSALMKGTYQLKVLNKNKDIFFDTGEFENLITDAALSMSSPFVNYYSDSTLGNFYLCVGAGVVTAPTVSDVNLGNQIAAKSFTNQGYGFLSFSKVSVEGVFPIIYKCSQVATFTGISGDLSELGVRRGSSSGTLVSRSLIKDGAGDPIQISVTTEQTVEITYSVYSIVPSDVISTGVMSTPYGDSNYTVHAGTKPYGIHMLNFHLPISFNASPGLFKLLNSADNSGTVTVESMGASTYYTRNPADQTVTVHLHFDAKDTDQTFDRIYGSTSPSTAIQAPWVELETPITIPAFYDFHFDITFTWGRYVA